MSEDRKEKIKNYIVTVILGVFTSILGAAAVVILQHPDFEAINGRLDGLETRVDALESGSPAASVGIDDKTVDSPPQENIASEDQPDGESFPGPAYLTALSDDSYFPNLLSNLDSGDSEVVLPDKEDPPSDGSYIATDISTGEPYTIETLQSKSVLLLSRDQSRETYFLGQYSESGQWDGRCITNVYENQKLTLITEAEYKEGDLRSYKQAFSGDHVTWFLSERTVKKDSNGKACGIGTTKMYRYEDFVQQFAYDQVTNEDIVNINGFERFAAGLKVSGYYSGNTSNGFFNDTTGNAYLTGYFDDGTVRTLYVGNFKDGYFSDDTGNAFMIGKSFPDQPQYAYYHGQFENGEPVDGTGSWEGFLTQDRIHEILDGKSFSCALTGLE